MCPPNGSLPIQLNVADHLSLGQDVHLVAREDLLRLAGGVERLIGLVRDQRVLLVGETPMRAASRSSVLM
jgi:hypothetical protein